jgi:hypothetical protein
MDSHAHGREETDLARAVKAGPVTEAMDAMKTITSVVAALVLVLALATTASAQTSVQGYNDRAGQIQSEVEQGGGNVTSPVSAQGGGGGGGGGSLPFTGLDVALLLGAGGLLVAAGLGMRRLTRAPRSA